MRVIDLHLPTRHLFLRKWQLSSAVSLGRTALERTVWAKRYQVQNAIICSRSFPTVLCQKNITNISRIGLATTFFLTTLTKKDRHFLQNMNYELPYQTASMLKLIPLILPRSPRTWYTLKILQLCKGKGVNV